MRKYILIFISLLICGLLNAQDILKTETDTHIFWQPDRVLKKGDFKGDGNLIPKSIKYCDELNMCTMASLGVFAVLDIPKKKQKRGELIEKAYFVPAFEKTTSYILKNDSLGIEKQKIVFDIYEISARFARQQLKHLQDSVGGYGIISIMFKSVEAQAIQMRNSFVDSYTKDIYNDKREGVYEDWRKQIDKLLIDTKEFATKPEDCYRFIKKQPLDDNYEQAKSVIDNLYK